MYKRTAGLGSTSQSIVYVLVSIMSGLYHRPADMESMMRATYNLYGHLDIPIVYVCGDTVYNITKDYLFRTEGRDPVEKGRESWLRLHHQTVKKLQAEHLRLNHEIVYWDTLKKASSYLDIRKFTDVVFNSALTLEILQEKFPGVDGSRLSDLLQDISEASILNVVPVIAQEFRSKNLHKLERREKDKAKRITQLRAELARETRVVQGEQTHLSEETPELVTLKSGLELATHDYLSEEYAVFLLLSFLQNSLTIKNTLKLGSMGLDAAIELNPILVYPITATKGSDVIFKTFQDVEALYLKYCVFLNLPIISQPVELMDLPVTEVFSNEARSEASSVSEDTERESKSASATKLFSAYPSLPFFSSSEGLAQIALKIIDKIDAHLKLKSTATTRTLYKNGITCEITSSTKLKASDEITDLADISMLIESAISNVKKETVEADTAIFNYSGHRFELMVKLTENSLSLRLSSPAAQK